MKNEKVIEKLAIIDGAAWQGNGYGKRFLAMPDDCESGCYGIASEDEELCEDAYNYIPNYLSDHNAIQRIIDKMEVGTICAYRGHLDRAVGCQCSYFKCLTATCEQKSEAILKAYGKWETE